MCVGLCCVSEREITRPWLWLSALAWVDSYPMSRWLSNEQDLTVRVTHDQRGCRLSREELVNGGWRNAWLGQNKTRITLSRTKKKKKIQLHSESDCKERNAEWQGFCGDSKTEQMDSKDCKKREKQRKSSRKLCVTVDLSTATAPQANRAVKHYLPYRCITCLCCRGRGKTVR